MSEVAKEGNLNVKLQERQLDQLLENKRQLEDLIEKDWRSSEWICIGVVM